MAVIDRDLAAFIEGPVMMVLATRSASQRPALARGLGARPSPDGGLIDVFASRRQWPQALADLAPGAAVAFTVCHPGDYRTYQIKGRVTEVAPAADEDRAWAARYMREVAAELSRLGVGPRQISVWLAPEDLMRLRLIPEALFLQTPGAGAGQAIPACAA